MISPAPINIPTKPICLVRSAMFRIFPVRMQCKIISRLTETKETSDLHQIKKLNLIWGIRSGNPPPPFI